MAVALFPAVYRANCVDNMPCNQVVATGNSRFAGWASTDSAALGKQVWTGRPVDGAINPSAAQKRSVSRIDNGIDIQTGYIPLLDINSV